MAVASSVGTPNRWLKARALRQRITLSLTLRVEVRVRKLSLIDQNEVARSAGERESERSMQRTREARSPRREEGP